MSSYRERLVLNTFLDVLLVVSLLDLPVFLRIQNGFVLVPVLLFGKNDKKPKNVFNKFQHLRLSHPLLPPPRRRCFQRSRQEPIVVLIEFVFVVVSDVSSYLLDS